SVEKILKRLELDHIQTLYVFNKMDRIDLDLFEDKWLLNQGVTVSATQKQSLTPLVEKLESMVTLQN
ncbi:MAG: GTPase HflX, partial [Desulfobacula sp.]|nr:GTPase HflX [Desulfobacula sp.]